MSAGIKLSKAGFNVGDCNTGSKKLSKNIPRNSIIVVIIEETPIAKTDIISAFFVPGSTLAIFILLKAAGNFKLLIFPVINER